MLGQWDNRPSNPAYYIVDIRLHEPTNHRMEIPKIRVKIINEQQFLFKHIFRQIVQCDSLEKPRK